MFRKLCLAVAALCLSGNQAIAQAEPPEPLREAIANDGISAAVAVTGKVAVKYDAYMRWGVTIFDNHIGPDDDQACFSLYEFDLAQSAIRKTYESGNSDDCATRTEEYATGSLLPLLRKFLIEDTRDGSSAASQDNSGNYRFVQEEGGARPVYRMDSACGGEYFADASRLLNDAGDAAITLAEADAGDEELDAEFCSAMEVKFYLVQDAASGAYFLETMQARLTRPTKANWLVRFDEFTMTERYKRVRLDASDRKEVTVVAERVSEAKMSRVNIVGTGMATTRETVTEILADGQALSLD